MSRIQVWNMAGEEVKKMNIKNEVFGIEPNTAVMHAAVVNYLEMCIRDSACRMFGAASG